MYFAKWIIGFLCLARFPNTDKEEIMEKIKIEPYAMFLRKEELKRILPKKLSERLLGDNHDLFGVVIDIKAFDKIDNAELFMEYAFGNKKEVKPNSSQH